MTSDFKRQPPSSSRLAKLGPPMRLDDADARRADMPLFEAVYWVATQGGSIDFDVFVCDEAALCDEAARKVRCAPEWDDAWGKVIGAWRANKLTVTGRPASGEFPEKIDGMNVDGVRVIHPYRVDPVGDPISGTGPYIESWGRIDDASWEKGCNDKLYRPGKNLGWTHLQVMKEEVRQLFPFITADTPNARWKPKPRASLTSIEAAILEAIRDIWPDSKPDHKATARNEQIVAWLKRKKMSPASPRSIQRTFQKIRFT